MQPLKKVQDSHRKPVVQTEKGKTISTKMRAEENGENIIREKGKPAQYVASNISFAL
jgi:hypothetical protein